MENLECGYGFTQQCTVNHLWYKENEVPIMIACGIKGKCEGPFQVTDAETP